MIPCKNSCSDSRNQHGNLLQRCRSEPPVGMHDDRHQVMHVLLAHTHILKKAALVSGNKGRTWLVKVHQSSMIAFWECSDTKGKGIQAPLFANVVSLTGICCYRGFSCTLIAQIACRQGIYHDIIQAICILRLLVRTSLCDGESVKCNVETDDERADEAFENDDECQKNRQNFAFIETD